MRAAALALIVACAGAQPPAPVEVGARSAASSSSEPARSPRSSASARALGPTATFAELVAAARRLDDRGEGASDAGCLLRGSASEGGAFRLEADLAASVRPLPDPPPLAPRLGGAGTVRVLTRWGQRGEGTESFAAFTALPPPPPGDATLLAITDDGVRLATTGAPLPAADRGPHRLDALDAPLARVLERAGGEVYVTAEPGTSLRRLVAVLARLPARVQDRVALAVLLPEGVTLPAPPATDDDEGLCPEGLPASAEEPGALDPSQLRASLGPLVGEARECLSRAAPEAARGGRLQLWVRVGPGGAVRDACVERDEVGDPRLRRCVLEATRRHRWPDPSGEVDLALPLTLVPDRQGAPRALCR